MKKLFCIFSAVLLAFSLVSCGSEPAPALEDVRDEFVALIESSYEINEILFGDGIPVYKRDGSDEETSFYNGLGSELDGYELVKEDYKYQMIEQIEQAARAVYTEEYLAPVLQIATEGLADEVMGVTPARFFEWQGYLYQNMNLNAIIDGTRKYNFDSMKMVEPSTADYVNIQLESELDGESLTVTLAFKKCENGWRLDTPTY